MTRKELLLRGQEKKKLQPKKTPKTLGGLGIDREEELLNKKKIKLRKIISDCISRSSCDMFKDYLY